MTVLRIPVVAVGLPFVRDLACSSPDLLRPMESLGCCFGPAGAQQKYAQGKTKRQLPTTERLWLAAHLALRRERDQQLNLPPWQIESGTVPS
jgi:hypothetical protein